MNNWSKKYVSAIPDVPEIIGTKKNRTMTETRWYLYEFTFKKTGKETSFARQIAAVQQMNEDGRKVL